MSKPIWEKIITAGLLAMGLGVMAEPALATYSHDCKDGGTYNPDCATWKFDGKSTDTEIGITATATGWSNTVGSENVLLASAYVGTWSGGLGVGNYDEGGSSAGSPNHAIDNAGKVDSVLFTFTNGPVNVSSFDTGWSNSYDSDFTVMAYTGAGTPASLANQSYSSLLSSGWSLVGTGTSGYGGAGHYDGGGVGNHNFSNTVWSSYWLIGALNTFVGGDASKAGNDYFKLLSLAGCDCSTAPPGTPGCGSTPSGNPEPGTLLLMGAGLFGLLRMNRQRGVGRVA